MYLFMVMQFCPLVPIVRGAIFSNSWHHDKAEGKRDCLLLELTPYSLRKWRNRLWAESWHTISVLHVWHIAMSEIRCNSKCFGDQKSKWNFMARLRLNSRCSFSSWWESVVYRKPLITVWPYDIPPPKKKKENFSVFTFLLVSTFYTSGALSQMRPSSWIYYFFFATKLASLGVLGR